MDTALQLRKIYDRGEELSERERARLLGESPLLERLTAEFSMDALFLVWRILALSEIPFAGELDYTQRIIQGLLSRMATDQGFVLTGKEQDLLPCYNAMVIKALCRLGMADQQCVRKGIEWILTYQPFARNHSSTWDGSGTKKYGGCLKSTPCFIGVAKSVQALIEYHSHFPESRITSRIEEGTEYILQHQVYKRLRSGEPITKHILDISFPESYHLNIIELLITIDSVGKIRDQRVNDALEYIRGKRKKDGTWRINYVYKAKGYMSFDTRGQAGDWVTYLLEQILAKCR